MINLSPKLARVVTDGSLDCPTGKLNLNKADVKALTQILSGEADTKAAVDRKRAVRALVQVGEGRKSAAVLAKILLDANEEDATRFSAAAGLGQVGDESSEKALIQALEQTEGTLQREVVKAIGRIGGERSYAALNALSRKGEPGLKRLLAFSKTLTAYRSEKASIDPGEARAALGVEWTKLEVRKLPKKRVQESIKTLRKNPFTLKLSEEIGYELMCGKIVNTLLVSDAYRPGNLLENLKSRSQISGMMVLRNPREIISTVRHLVMTNVTEAGVDIIVTRTSGEVVYAGEAAPDGDVWRFSLRDISSTSAPTAVSGVISDKEVEFNVRSILRRTAKTGQRLN